MVNVEIMEGRKFKDESNRLQNWDYGSNGRYFITICTSQREPWFGFIQNQKMNLSDHGLTAWEMWHEIPVMFPFAKTDAFVVMPDHIHGIIIIDREINQYNRYVGTRLIASLHNDTTEPGCGGVCGDKNPMFQENVSRIIRWYKGRCTFEIRKTNSHFSWQRLFYDHVIKSDESFSNIVRYIENNPKNWDGEK